ncbi:MAG: peptidylprolyl isomerase [Planctomycetota bacterium]
MSTAFAQICLVATLFITDVGLAMNFRGASDSVSCHSIIQSSFQEKDSQICATVAGIPIRTKFIESRVDKATKKFSLSQRRKEQLFELQLKIYIDQIIVMNFLQSKNFGAQDSELKLEWNRLQARLDRVGKAMEDYLAENDLTEDELRRELEWKLCWKKYLDNKIDDPFLREHFDRSPRKFDGTELRVAHLLVKKGAAKSPSELAENIKKQLSDQKLIWAEAVRKYSQAPTRESEGALGWIRWQGSMPENFTHAAFELKTLEISQPVETRFGVHLIRCLEVKQGKMGFLDAKDLVRQDAEKQLFAAIAAKHRKAVSIERIK